MALFKTHQIQAIAKVVRNADISERQRGALRQDFVEMFQTFHGQSFNDKQFRNWAGTHSLDDFFDGRMASAKTYTKSPADNS
jgi:hypothetical protein